MLERNAQIVAMARQEPVPTLQEIGDKFGISREWVRQILVKHNVTKPDAGPVAKTRPCKFIGCQNRHTTKGARYCDEHAYTSYGGQHSLSAQFRILTCSYCGKQYQRSEYYLKFAMYPHRLRNGPTQRWTFCSKTCQGKLLGRDFGFAAQRKARV